MRSTIDECDEMMDAKHENENHLRETEVRNDIAHNPVMLNLFVQEQTGDVAYERSIATARGGRFIDLATVKEFADEVEDLAATMWLQIGTFSVRD